MATIQEEVLEAFYTRLSACEAVDDRMLDKLKKLFASEGKLRADDFVAVFDEDSEDELS